MYCSSRTVLSIIGLPEKVQNTLMEGWIALFILFIYLLAVYLMTQSAAHSI
jgi:hypothetical protein